MNIPEDLHYTKTHEWVKKTNRAQVIVGITDHAQQQLQDIVFVELPPVGNEVKKGAACAVVESVKAAYDIYAPVSGKVTKINELLQDKPELVNEDPYEKGWFFQLEIANEEELGKLLNAVQYRDVCEAEA